MEESAEQLGRKEWISAAIEAAAEGGIDNVRVERLARRLRVTKGSFYWHFKDRNALLQALLEAWQAMQATTVIKLGLRSDLSESDTIDLALRALLEAADEDSATGGPDMVRGIYPVVATIGPAGFTRVDDDDLAARFETILAALRESHS